MTTMLTPEQQEQFSQAQYALEAAGIDPVQLHDKMIDNPEQVAIEVSEDGDFRLFDPFQLVDYAAPRDANGWTCWALLGE